MYSVFIPQYQDNGKNVHKQEVLVQKQPYIFSIKHLSEQLRSASQILPVGKRNEGGPISPQTVINRLRQLSGTLYVIYANADRTYVPFNATSSPATSVSRTRHTMNRPGDLSPRDHKWGESGRRVCQSLVQPHTRCKLQQLEDGLHEVWRALPTVTVKTYFFNTTPLL